MSKHLSDQGVSMYLIGGAGLEERQHAEECPTCRARIASLTASLTQFRGAVRNWSDRAGAKDRAAELHWTVIPAADHLERMLLPASLETPWYRSLWSNLRDFVTPERPPLDITSKPVLVRDIWGQYGHQKKSWAMSFGMQCALVVLMFTVASSKNVQQKVRQTVSLVLPMDPYTPQAPPQRNTMQGGGGGGDRSPLPASKGRLPKAAIRQFVPPQAVLNNTNAKITMEPAILAPPNVTLPQVNMAQYGDPLGRIGPASNGTGSGGGIGGGVYRVGGGVSAPSLIYKKEPEYSEEARKAKYQGIVTLYVEVDPSGKAVNVRVLHSLGLGLDEKAMEAVRQWKFKPGMKDGKPVTVAASIEVNFRLL